MEFSEEELEEILSIFQEESEEQIQKLNDNLLRLESNPQEKKAIQEIFREAHSLKGAARMIGLDDVQTIAHKLEDIFGLARTGDLEIRPEVVDIMCSAVDAIASIIEDSVKNKGTHSVDVQAVVTQLTMIETGEMNNLFAAIPKDVSGSETQDEDASEEDDDYDYDFPEIKIESKEKTAVKAKETPLVDPALEEVLLLKSSPEDTQLEYNIEQEGFSEEELSELKQIFYAESFQTIDHLFNGIDQLRQSPYDREILSEAYRNANSLEGATRIINFSEIKDFTYSIRDIFEQASKEELFINSDILEMLKKQLKQVKTILEDKQKQDGHQTEMDLEELQEQINQKMEIYKTQKLEPKKVKKEKKVSLSSDALNFDEEEVLKEFGVVKSDEKPEFKQQLKKPEKLAEKPDEIADIKLEEHKEEIKKQLGFDPLSLSDEELGDMELGSLKGVIKLPEDEKPPEPDFSKISSSNWSISSKAKPVESDEEEGLNELLARVRDDLQLLSHNVKNESLIKKLNANITKIKDLSVKEENHILLAIISKAETIFAEANEGTIVFTTEMVIVISQSIESARSLISLDTDESDDIIEDPSLIYQRLMILHQTIRLTAGIPFEEEEEPDIFHQKPEQSKDKSKAQSVFDKIDAQVKDVSIEASQQIESSKKLEVKQEDEPRKDSRPIEPVSKPIIKASMPSFKSKSDMSPVGEMSKAQDKVADGLETYTIKTLRVDTRKLDQLVAQVGELIIAKIKAKERLTDIEKLLNEVEDWQRDWAKTKYAVKKTDKKQLKAAFMPEGTSIYTPGKDMRNIIRENSDRLANFTNHLNVLYRNIQEDDTRLTLIIGELEEKIKNVRLLPLSTIFNMYPRMVRDLARQQNKEIDLEIRGSETTVDKKIIEEIKSPLMHLIRNAVDHGQETPELREQNGKSRTGKIILSAYHLENSVKIEIQDDGRGIDINAIKVKVLEKELLTQAELDVMNENQIMNIIFWPGFSTNKEVTDLSGRGVGMDVVHTKITQLNGKVKVHSKLGEGCNVSIQLPVTMATIQVFLVRIKNQTYAIPASAIKTAVLVKPEEIFFKEGRQTVLVSGVPVLLSNLAELLELGSSSEEEHKKEKMTVLVIQTEEINIGFIVDGLLGDQEILHKNLSPPLIRIRNVAGVTTLGSGEVCLILNVGDLIKTAQMNYGMSLRSAYSKKAQIESKKQEILVVDDSVTTRILERNILRAAGYNVTVAVNGLDALTKLTTQHIDLIVSDVEMPDISGYELTSRIKKDEMLSKIPVILVTSLASEVDRQKGMNSGASAYITKGGFDQEELLSTVRRLLAL